MTTIAIPIDSEIIGEMFLRTGPKANITDWVENILTNYLERTAEDEWSAAYYDYREKQSEVENFASEFGDPKGGYHWAPIFLPNGTQIRMEYKKELFNAVVKNNKVMFEEESYSPSELARNIAAGTSRNAWRDLLIKRPGDTNWALAYDLRRKTIK